MYKRENYMTYHLELVKMKEVQETSNMMVDVDDSIKLDGRIPVRDKATFKSKESVQYFSILENLGFTLLFFPPPF